MFHDFLGMKATDSRSASASVGASSDGCVAGRGPISFTSNLGSGSGFFIIEMGKNRKDLNFLGLEINGKVKALAITKKKMQEYFIETIATSTFRSIISSYPGYLVLVSIQCPNPDFNKPECRWSMLQRSLIEAVADLFSSKGKVT
ncbi:hypothetical protein PTKIN_Ptkin08bG0078900 [Pterospermum kingtungense]